MSTGKGTKVWMSANFVLLVLSLIGCVALDVSVNGLIFSPLGKAIDNKGERSDCVLYSSKVIYGALPWITLTVDADNALTLWVIIEKTKKTRKDFFLSKKRFWFNKLWLAGL